MLDSRLHQTEPFCIDLVGASPLQLRLLALPFLSDRTVSVTSNRGLKTRAVYSVQWVRDPIAARLQIVHRSSARVENSGLRSD